MTFTKKAPFGGITVSNQCLDNNRLTPQTVDKRQIRPGRQRTTNIKTPLLNTRHFGQYLHFTQETPIEEAELRVITTTVVGHTFMTLFLKVRLETGHQHMQQT